METSCRSSVWWLAMAGETQRKHLSFTPVLRLTTKMEGAPFETINIQLQRQRLFSHRSQKCPKADFFYNSGLFFMTVCECAQITWSMFFFNLIWATFISCSQPEKTIQEMNVCTTILLIFMMDCCVSYIFCCSAACWL